MTYTFNPSMNWKDVATSLPSFLNYPPSGFYNRNESPINSGYFLPTTGNEYVSGVVVNRSALDKNVELAYAWFGIDVRYNNVEGAMKSFLNIVSTGTIPPSISGYLYDNVKALAPNSGHPSDYYSGKYCACFQASGYFDLNNYNFLSSRENSGCIDAYLFNRRFKSYNDPLDIELVVSKKIGNYSSTNNYGLNLLSLKFSYSGVLHTQILYKELYEEYIVEGILDNFFSNPTKIYKTILPINPTITSNVFYTRHPIHIDDIGTRINIDNIEANYAYSSNITQVLSTTQPTIGPGGNAAIDVKRTQLASQICGFDPCVCVTDCNTGSRLIDFPNVYSYYYNAGTDHTRQETIRYIGSEILDGYVEIDDFRSSLQSYIYDGFLLTGHTFRGDIFYKKVLSNFKYFEDATITTSGNALTGNQSQANYDAMLATIEPYVDTYRCIRNSIYCMTPGEASCRNDGGGDSVTEEWSIGYDFYRNNLDSLSYAAYGASNKTITTTTLNQDSYLIYSFSFGYGNAKSEAMLHFISNEFLLDNDYPEQNARYQKQLVYLYDFPAGTDISGTIYTSSFYQSWYFGGNGPFGPYPPFGEIRVTHSDKLYDITILSDDKVNYDTYIAPLITSNSETSCLFITPYYCDYSSYEYNTGSGIVTPRYSEYQHYRIDYPLPYKQYDNFIDTFIDYDEPPESKKYIYNEIENFVGQSYLSESRRTFTIDTRVYPGLNDFYEYCNRVPSIFDTRDASSHLLRITAIDNSINYSVGDRNWKGIDVSNATIQ